MGGHEIDALGRSLEITRRDLLIKSGLMAGAIAAAPQSSFAARPSTPQGAPMIIASASRNVVETDSGNIYGFSRAGVIGYRGIPYGANTESANRFMPPQKPAPWTGVRSALYWGWASPQSNNATWDGRRAGWSHDEEAFMCEWDDGQPSEDCLRLNVWTPGLDNKKRAVMLFLHGGGTTSGSDNEMRSYDGENLAREGDVVAVTINHRLGVLGFLNLMAYGDEFASSANVSMLDAVAALRWVQVNISNFGGDPSRVMIFGQSGGGVKVSTLMAMPSAKGLFHRASIQSGSNLRSGSVDASTALAQATLTELGVSKANIRKLQTDFTFQQIVQAGIIAQRKIAANRSAGGALPMGGGFGPVVDGNIIPTHPWDPTAPGPAADVPVIIGTVLNEGFNTIQMADASLESMDIAEAKRRIGRTSGGVANADFLVDVFQKLHPKATPFETFSLVSAMRGRMNAYKQAELKARQGGAPAYLYWFQWQSPMCDGRGRAFHTVELPFCFNNASLCAKITGNSPQSHALASQMSGAWTSFAKSGNPNHAGLPKWDAYNDKVPTMIFNSQSTAANDPDGDLRKAIQQTT